MLSNVEFVRQSLELNLFFMRIAKEHSIFLEVGFTQKNPGLARQADMLKNQFSQLLVETTQLSCGIISPEVANSGELITDMTLDAERETEYYTAIPIDTNITKMEANLIGCTNVSEDSDIVTRVTELNQRAIAATNRIASFKSRLLRDVLSCKVFTTNYPLLIDHILREAHFYLRMLTMLQNRQEINIVQEAVNQETFWNRIMAEHAKFIRGLLDPTEVKLFDTANDYGKKFDELTIESQNLAESLGLLPNVTQRSLKATVGIRDFKKQGTGGLLNCTIRSIAYPLLGDHVLREANHYIRLLKSFSQARHI
ncbi:hypothetical protein U732_4080 [Clostridium argentinense CDC 2741]|uniref:DUF2935 domain-containing protein n=1 Tax=Clostridium argentinense CDC 2741 TaxID=1418104 RepID=A0A0C1RD62_9CLOT|nr:DUF2935 domain-containing protein [Clostridium argentinense]ARC84911.1 hypothetical protein RSJ17_10475 [Clostridium argentinense]KIE48331.1 hypothetical protein U732_4080 [Clostridium argentinense CDC 2741]NFF40710.1 DUF2935 domain-containing protein [Clostridium argentinense]NFP51943.1 DUF2935 domain-containing protein [Clostridium argentinense]NFP73879.1 DUF2935 domain-containing protein [Clostridium argentinense]